MTSRNRASGIVFDVSVLDGLQANSIARALAMTDPFADSASFRGARERVDAIWAWHLRRA